MSEQVEEILESMVPALKDLQERELMSAMEVKTLVEQRRQYEYKLQRRQPRKADFLRYVEYEFKVDSLRKMRKQRLHVTKNTLCDFAQAQHIFFIFERSTRKFQADKDMWMQYIDYAISEHAEKRLGQLLPRALQLHPRHPPLWIRAASWQYFNLNNSTAARILLQRALRLNPTSQEIWLEYFRMELHYMVKISARRGVLGLEAKQDDTLYQGAVPRTIYDNAVQKAHDDSLIFRRKFLDICCSFDGAQHVSQHILDSIGTDYRSVADAWILKATYHFIGIETAHASRGNKRCKIDQCKTMIAAETRAGLTNAEKQSLSIFELGVSTLPQDPILWTAYAKFLRERASQRPEGSNGASALLELSMTIFERAVAAGAATESMFLEWSTFAASSSSSDEKAILRRGLQHCASSIELWVALLRAVRRALVQEEATNCKSKSSILDATGHIGQILDEAIRSIVLVADCSSKGSFVKVSEVTQLFQPVLETAMENKMEEVVQRRLIEAIRLCYDDGVPIVLCCQILRWSYLEKGLEGARSTFKQIKAAYRGGSKDLGPVIMEFAGILRSVSGASLNTNSSSLRSIFESALAHSYPESLQSIFAAYEAFEVAIGDHGKAGALHWREEEHA